MAYPDKTPSFNMKVVVQETGIKPDTHGFSRRVGIHQGLDGIQASRSTRGHRAACGCPLRRQAFAKALHDGAIDTCGGMMLRRVHSR